MVKLNYSTSLNPQIILICISFFNEFDLVDLETFYLEDKMQ